MPKWDTCYSDYVIYLCLLLNVKHKMLWEFNLKWQGNIFVEFPKMCIQVMSRSY
jgi:hypothetical protein